MALAFPAQDSGVGVKDIMPRMGAAYDLFGNGRTAFKLSFGRYVTPENSFGTYGGAQNPTARVAGQTNRQWTDRDRNYVRDCDLLNPLANGECGPWSNRNFGREVFSVTYDPAVLNGWNAREYSWDLTATIDQEIAPRVSVEFSYARRVWGNFTVTDNRAVGPADYDPFRIVAPVDSRLPEGGGFIVDDLYDLNPSKFGQVDNVITFSDNFGTQTRHYNGVDVTIDARLANQLTVQGGFSTGQVAEDDCDVASKIDNPSRRFCHIETPFLTQIKGLAAYTIPRVDVQVSGTFQSKPYVGANNPSVAAQSLSANWVVPTSVIAPTLGRNLSGGTVTTINLVQPGTLYGDRINQIDLRFAKLLRYGRTRTRIALDLYNALNASTTESYRQIYGPTWLNPASIMAARIAKVSAQVDF